MNSLVFMEEYLTQLEGVIELKENNLEKEKEFFISSENILNFSKNNCFETEIFGKTCLNPFNGSLDFFEIPKNFLISFSAYLDNTNAGEVFFQADNSAIKFSTDITSLNDVKIVVGNISFDFLKIDNSFHSYQIKVKNGIATFFRDNQRIKVLNFPLKIKEFKIKGNIYLNDLKIKEIL